jgi:hypothetical protein
LQGRPHLTARHFGSASYTSRTVLHGPAATEPLIAQSFVIGAAIASKACELAAFFLTRVE